jgi:hypothetical protein
MPLGRPVTIELNGKTPVGIHVAELKQFLGDRRAVYRFEILCSRSRSGVGVRISRGVRQRGGSVEYVKAAAAFRNGRLLEYRAEPVNADSFWFR